MTIQTPTQSELTERQSYPPQGQWTYADYKRLPDDGWRYEVINGELKMSPAPKTRHQEAGFNLKLAMGNFVKSGRSGKVLDAPIDVRLGKLADPVQPDILFIRQDRLEMIREGWVEGAPDLIVEILSLSNWLDDRRTKYKIYAQAGVNEYWIVDPDARQVEIYGLHGGDYALLGRYGSDDQARSEVLSGFQVGVAEICPV